MSWLRPAPWYHCGCHVISYICKSQWPSSWSNHGWCPPGFTTGNASCSLYSSAVIDVYSMAINVLHTRHLTPLSLHRMDLIKADMSQQAQMDIREPDNILSSQLDTNIQSTSPITWWWWVAGSTPTIGEARNGMQYHTANCDLILSNNFPLLPALFRSFPNFHHEEFVA